MINEYYFRNNNNQIVSSFEFYSWIEVNQFMDKINTIIKNRGYITVNELLSIFNNYTQTDIIDGKNRVVVLGDRCTEICKEDYDKYGWDSTHEFIRVTNEDCAYYVFYVIIDFYDPQLLRKEVINNG